MQKPFQVALVALLVLACLEATSAQTKGTAPAPPAAPASPSSGASTPVKTSPPPPIYTPPNMRNDTPDLVPRISLPPLNTAPQFRKIGQGTIYAPEAHVPRAAMREFRKGVKALKRQEIKAAEEHLLRATELYPKFSSAFDVLGLAYEQDPGKRDKKTGFSVDARNAFRQAVRLDPTNDYALTNLGNALLRENAIPEAERVLWTAAAIRTGSARTYANLMLAQAAQHHFADVLMTAKKVPSGGEKEYPIIYFLRAAAWESKSDRVQAARDYREFLKHAPDAPEAPFARASLARLESR